MKQILTLIVLVFGITGCVGRKVVINPNDISRYNDVDWNVINESTTDKPGFSYEKNIEKSGQVEREWEIGE